jgi:hypothetical protein
VESVFPALMPRSMNFRSQRSVGEYNLCTSGFFREAAGGERLARDARLTIVDDQHAIADEHFTGDDWTLFSKTRSASPRRSVCPMPRLIAADAEQGSNEPTKSISASAGLGLHQTVDRRRRPVERQLAWPVDAGGARDGGGHSAPPEFGIPPVTRFLWMSLGRPTGGSRSRRRLAFLTSSTARPSCPQLCRQNG